MPDNSLAVTSGAGPYFTDLAQNASEPPPPDIPMCVDRASEGGEGASGAGAQALVRRFSDAPGAGGASGYVERAATEVQSCRDETLSALATCTAAALSTGGTAGVLLLVAGVKCAADLSSLVECLENQDAASEP